MYYESHKKGYRQSSTKPARIHSNNSRWQNRWNTDHRNGSTLTFQTVRDRKAWPHLSHTHKKILTIYISLYISLVWTTDIVQRKPHCNFHIRLVGEQASSEERPLSGPGGILAGRVDTTSRLVRMRTATPHSSCAAHGYQHRALCNPPSWLNQTE